MNRIPFNRNQLKYIVTVAMLIDHIAWAFVPLNSVLGQLMHFIGRLTGPTMAFFLAEGYLHTRSVKKYALRLAGFALVSWAPYSLFEMGRWPAPAFGVIYTLFLGLLAILVWDKTAWPRWGKVLAVVALCGFSLLGDWEVFDVLWPFFLVLYRADGRRKWRSYWIICLCASLPMILLIALMNKVWWSGICFLGVLVVPPMLQYCYNGAPGSRKPFHKWFFYVFYPLHLLILAGLQRVF